jgi:hypothetical protein
MTDDLEKLWNKFNQCARGERAADVDYVQSLVEEGKGAVAAYQKQVRVALALIKAAEQPKQKSAKRTAFFSTWGGSGVLGQASKTELSMSRWTPRRKSEAVDQPMID